MKKYTVIYRENFQIGSHWNTTVHHKRIETDNLLKTLTELNVEAEYVFEGWPALEDEQAQRETRERFGLNPDIV